MTPDWSTPPSAPDAPTGRSLATAGRSDAGFGRTGLWVAIAGILALVGAMVTFALRDRIEVIRETGPNLFSVSALGHRALVELIQDRNWLAFISRNDSVGKALASGALLVAPEPRPERMEPEAWEDVKSAPRLLVVLPKRHGGPDPDRPAWMEWTDLQLPFVPVRILQQFAPGASLNRPDFPGTWTRNPYEIPPSLTDPQLITGDGISPVIEAEQGILLGVVRSFKQQVWILSDPDLIANHGLDDGRNVELILAILDDLRDGPGPVIFDAMSQGYTREPSIWSALFDLPLLPATIHAIAAIAVLAWTGSGRFGAPVRAGEHQRAGQDTLIRAAADLLRAGGHGAEVIGSYADAVYRHVATARHAPAGLTADQRAQWLLDLERTRKPDSRLAATMTEIDRLRASQGLNGPRLLDAAQRLDQWKREMIDGPEDDSRHR